MDNDLENKGQKMTLFAFNKQIISQLPDYTDEQIDELAKAIMIWRKSKKDNYYLMYGRELNYFTLFAKDTTAIGDFTNEVIDCLKIGFDAIKEYDVNDEAVEIWVRSGEDVSVLYLFCYDSGVVYYE